MDYYKPSVDLVKIKLYSTGAKGKVYTTNFRKSMNHNFGIELTLKNNTNKSQRVKVGWCIYTESGQTVLNGTFHESITPHQTLQKDFYVKKQAFNNMKSGKYKSQFWINDKKVQKKFFTLTYK